MTYYQFIHTRTGKSLPFGNKTCAAKNQRLESGELFVTFTDGSVLATEAKSCPFCGAVFTEKHFDPFTENVENAHFLKTVSE